MQLDVMGGLLSSSSSTTTNPRHLGNLLERLKGMLILGPWYEEFDTGIIEFLASMVGLRLLSEQFRHDVNTLLEREVSGYRFVGEQIAPITDQLELGEIETALAGDSRAQFRTNWNNLSNIFLTARAPIIGTRLRSPSRRLKGYQVRSTLGKDNGTLGQLLPNFKKQFRCTRL